MKFSEMDTPLDVIANYEIEAAVSLGSIDLNGEIDLTSQDSGIYTWDDEAKPGNGLGGFIDIHWTHGNGMYRLILKKIYRLLLSQFSALPKGKTCYICRSFFGAVAQLVEQWTENPCVGGSIPPHTTKKPDSFKSGFLLPLLLIKIITQSPSIE